MYLFQDLQDEIKFLYNTFNLSDTIEQIYTVKILSNLSELLGLSADKNFDEE